MEGGREETEGQWPVVASRPSVTGHKPAAEETRPGPRAPAPHTGGRRFSGLGVSSGAKRPSAVGSNHRSAPAASETRKAAKEQQEFFLLWSSPTAMQITIKTISNQTFSLEVSEDTTVRAVKELISGQEIVGQPAVESQKLIFKGAVLADDATLASAHIVAGTTVVLMVSRAKPSSGAAVPAPAAAAPAVPAPRATASTTAAPAPATAPAIATATAPRSGEVAPRPVGAGNDLLLGSASETAISELCNMGFPREQVVQAMRAAFMNPDRAAEYLFSGSIPGAQGLPSHAPSAPVSHSPSSVAPAAGEAGEAANTDEQLAAAMAAESEAEAGDTGMEQEVEGEAEGDDGQMAIAFDLSAVRDFSLDTLRSNPQILALRFLIQSNPSLLGPILQQIGVQNPELLMAIQQNRAQFVSMLQLPLNQQEQVMAMAALQAMMASASALAGGNVAGSGPAPSRTMGAAPPGTLQVTPEENAAIERLASMGFPKALAAQAYFACDKNEELAANYLLEHGSDLMDDDQ